MKVEHPAGRLSGADTELEHPLGVDIGGRVGDGVLQLVVRRHLLTDPLEVGGRVEVELVTVGSLDHGCSLAGIRQPFGRSGGTPPVGRLRQCLVWLRFEFS